MAESELAATVSKSQHSTNAVLFTWAVGIAVAHFRQLNASEAIAVAVELLIGAACKRQQLWRVCIA